MYNFERRFNLTQEQFADLRVAKNKNESSLFGKLEMFIMLARTITFVMQKELNTKEKFIIWYKDKQKEMSEQFKDFIDLRNQIEKEGKTPVKSFSTTIDFKYNDEDSEVIGTVVDSYGNKKIMMGKSTFTQYFDKGAEKEIISRCYVYVDYLKNLVQEAIRIFPEIE